MVCDFFFASSGWCANFATVCEFSGQLAGVRIRTLVCEKKNCEGNGQQRKKLKNYQKKVYMSIVFNISQNEKN